MKLLKKKNQIKASSIYPYLKCKWSLEIIHIYAESHVIFWTKAELFM